MISLDRSYRNLPFPFTATNEQFFIFSSIRHLPDYLLPEFDKYSEQFLFSLDHMAISPRENRCLPKNLPACFMAAPLA